MPEHRLPLPAAEEMADAAASALRRAVVAALAVLACVAGAFARAAATFFLAARFAALIGVAAVIAAGALQVIEPAFAVEAPKTVDVAVGIDCSDLVLAAAEECLGLSCGVKHAELAAAEGFEVDENNVILMACMIVLWSTGAAGLTAVQKITSVKS